MLKSSSMPVALTIMRVAGLGSTLLLVFGILLLPSAAAAGLPRAAFSVPTDQAVAEGLKALEQCDVNGKIIVMPPVLFQLSEDDNHGHSFDEQARAIMGMPAGSEAMLHILVAAGALTGREPEKLISDRVSAFIERAPLTAPSVRGLIVEIQEPLTATNMVIYALLRMAVLAKAGRSDLRLGFVFPQGFIARHGEVVERVVTYFDLLGTVYSQRLGEDAAWIAEHALNKPLIVKLDAGMSTSTSSYVAATLAATGIPVEMLWSEPPTSKAAEKLCTLNSFLSHYITEEMLPIDPAASPFRIPSENLEQHQYRWFRGHESHDFAIVAHVNATPQRPVTVKLEGRVAGQFEIRWYDPATGAPLPACKVAKAEQGEVQSCACTTQDALVYIHQLGNAANPLYTSVEVKGRAELTIDEIIARWQQYRESQKARLSDYLAECFMNLHFESTNLGPGFDISMQLEEFYSRSGRMEFAQKELFVNGVKFNHKHEFPLPQLEPEKVVTQPLELKLNEKYQYRLLGTESVAGALCYVVSIEPKVRDETLYSGKVWIDGTSFREVKEILSERGSKSNVFVDVETQNFELVSDGKGNQFNLLRSITAQQLLNAAGRDFVLQRTLKFSSYNINTPQFDQTLTAEHKSDDPMYGETDEGLRALRRKGEDRVLVETNQKRIRSFVMGAMYEGTFNFPIPIFGVSMADFNFRNSGAQLSTFFAGPLVASDLSKQYGTKWRLATDVALSAIPGENRVYMGDSEVKNKAVWYWEEDTGVRVSWQATTSLSLTASSYLAYNYFLATSDTDKSYVLPRNGVTLLPGLELKYARRGYIFTAQGTRGERIQWTRFGYAAQSQSLQPGYTLYSADFNKDFYWGKFTKAGGDISYYGGNQLDRFSRYLPSFFSIPRIHGIPTGTDSFDAMAIANAHFGFNIMQIAKFETMYSYARARNMDESSSFRKFDGLESTFSTPGPMGTLLQGTVGFALDGNIGRYNSRWSAYVLIIKPLR